MRANTSRQRQPLLIALAAALALLVGLLTACSSSQNPGTATAAASPAATSVMSMPAALSASHAEQTSSEVALYTAMRTLWEQHMEWTYAAIAAFADGSRGFPATAARLLQNQTDIGNAVKPYYGDVAGNALTTLLVAHINGFVAILKAAKANDTTAYNTAATAEYANAQAIGDFLAKANPKYWPQAEMRQMMKTHIDQTVVYASDQLHGQYADSITAYGTAESHMLQMADMLSAGVIGAFPNKFNV